MSKPKEALYMSFSEKRNFVLFSFTNIGDETVIGGFNIAQLPIESGQSPGHNSDQS